MKATEIKKQLHDYIEAVDSKKLKAIYTVMEQDIKSHADIWEDEDFVNELDRRKESFLNGTTNGHTWEEVKANARKALAEKKKENAG